MAQESLITDINEWLVDQALGEPDIREMFDSACQRLHAIGLPVQRARLSWPTLHPLFRAETVLWLRGSSRRDGVFPPSGPAIGRIRAAAR